MPNDVPPIAWFDQLGRDDIPTAGGKGANLGELPAAGLPDPRGVVVTGAGYLAAMEEAGVRGALMARSDQARTSTDDPAALREASIELRTTVQAGWHPGLAARTARRGLCSARRQGVGA